MLCLKRRKHLENKPRIWFLLRKQKVKQQKVSNNTEDDEYWEEILQSVDVDYLPVEYVDWIVVTFKDGNVWEIDITKTSKQNEDVGDVLDDFFEEYDETISDVSFKLNLPKIKKDIGKRTRRFLKLNK